MGFADEEVRRLGFTARRHIKKQQAAQAVDHGTVSEIEFADQLRRAGVHDFLRDWPKKSRGESWPAPIKNRKWSFDFVFHDQPLRALGVWIHGQVHGQRGTGKMIGDGLRAEKAGPRTRDYEAANVLHAVLYPLGWTIMTFSPQQVGSGVAIRSVKAWLSGDDGALLLALQGKSK